MRSGKKDLEKRVEKVYHATEIIQHEIFVFCYVFRTVDRVYAFFEIVLKVDTEQYENSY